MELIDASVSLTVGVLGVAYPVLLQGVTRLDDKYKSTVIVELFTKEPALKWFRYLLVASLIAIAIWGLKLPVLIDCGIFHYILPNSGERIAQLASVALAVVFFLLVAKVITYSITIQVVRYLMKKHDMCIVQDDFRHFAGLSDILFTSIRDVNQSVVTTISDYLYEAFKRVRIAQAGKPIEYPDHYYRLLYNILLELDAKPDPRFRFLAARAVGGIWLLGEMTENEISQSTYQWMWILVRHSIQNNHDDYVMDLWEHADQHAAYQLDAIEEEYANDLQVLNQAAIDKRKKERHDFEQFFMALGGLALYRKRPDLIRRMFQHTRSLPPRYELLPERMDDVFHWYNWFFDHGHRNFSWIESTYSMPGLSSMGNEGETKVVILRYIALLFIRQYNLHAYYVYQNPLAMPAIPATQVEKSNWLASMDVMSGQVSELYNDRDLMKAIGFGYINDEWCLENQKRTPLQLLADIKTSIANSIQQGLQEQQPAEDKVKLFLETSKAILVPVMKDVLRANGKDSPGKDIQKWYITGQHQRQDKSAFVHDQQADHLNYHSFLAEQLSTRIRDGISEVFWRCKTTQYLIHKEQVKDSLNRLVLGNERYVVISFGIDAGELVTAQGGSFPNIQFMFFANSISRLAGRCFFILRESDLPQISFLPPGDEWVDKEHLVVIDQSVELYGAVVDLHSNDAVRSAIQADAPQEDLHKSVLTTLAFNIEWKFRKNFTCIYFSFVTPQRQQGIPNELKDIQPFNN